MSEKLEKFEKSEKLNDRSRSFSGEVFLAFNIIYVDAIFFIKKRISFLYIFLELPKL